MDLVYYLIDIILHIDVHLFELAQNYGTLVYLFLFIIIFCETGLVITPFLPGDSLLFACGTLAGAGVLSLPLLFALIFCAAVIGDFVNYSIGKHIGPPVFEKNYRFLKKEYLLDAHAFYEKHGGKAIVLARFVPIIRTFAPFIGGVANMNPGRFLFFNISGALSWVVLLLGAGYFLGSIPWVQSNFALIAYGIILVSVTPMAIGVLNTWKQKKKEKRTRADYT